MSLNFTQSKEETLFFRVGEKQHIISIEIISQQVLNNF